MSSRFPVKKRFPTIGREASLLCVFFLRFRRVLQNIAGLTMQHLAEFAAQKTGWLCQMIFYDRKIFYVLYTSGRSHLSFVAQARLIKYILQ